jgi:tyrosyl-tRNA synthetase
MASKSAARRSIDEGGAYLNNERITNEAYVPGAADWLHGEFLLLRKGKRSIAGVRQGS